MKKLYFFIVFIALLTISCKNSPQESEPDKVISENENKPSYKSFGKEINESGGISAIEMEEAYHTMKPGDTVQVKFTSKVVEVCKSKGCWMTLDLPNNEESVMVKFQDYGFFVPKDIDDKEVIINGKAFVSEVSVEEQQHYAKDGGKTEEEIAAITKPKRTLSFIADGVLIAENN